VEQVTISGEDGQTTSDHHRTANLLNALHLQAPTRGTVMKVAGNDVPWAVGQGPAGGTADVSSAVRERPWHLPIQSVHL